MTAAVLKPGVMQSRSLDKLAVLVLILLAWQCLYFVVGDIALSSPWNTLARIYTMVIDPGFWSNVWASFRPFGLALLLQTIAGILVGALLGTNRLLGEVFEPVLASLYALPKVLFYPLIILSAGLGIASEVIFAFIHGFFPIALFTIGAIKTLKPIYMKTAHSLRLSLWQRLSMVAVPAVVPEIFTGIRVGYGTTLLGVLLFEMFGSKNGLGNLLMNAIASNRVTDTLALATMIAIFAWFTNQILILIDRRLHKRF